MDLPIGETMKASIKIKETEAHYNDGLWSCADPKIEAQLNGFCLGDYPAFEPDPEGRDLELAVARFGAEIVERTHDEHDPDLVY